MSFRVFYHRISLFSCCAKLPLVYSRHNGAKGNLQQYLIYKYKLSQKFLPQNICAIHKHHFLFVLIILLHDFMSSFLHPI